MPRRALAPLVLVASLTALAACADGPPAPTAPAGPAARGAAGAALSGLPSDPAVGPVQVALTVDAAASAPAAYDTALSSVAAVGGATVRLRTDKGFTVDVADGAAADADKRPGYLSVEMPNARWISAQVVAAPLPWTAVDGPVATKWVAGDAISMTARVNRRPRLGTYVDQLVAYAYRTRTTGGSVTVTGPNGYKAIATAPDKAYVPDVFVPYPNATYTVCLTAAPAHTTLNGPACRTVTTSGWNQFFRSTFDVKSDSYVGY